MIRALVQSRSLQDQVHSTTNKNISEPNSASDEARDQNINQSISLSPAQYLAQNVPNTTEPFDDVSVINTLPGSSTSSSDQYANTVSTRQLPPYAAPHGSIDQIAVDNSNVQEADVVVESNALLGELGIKVRDFAYESTLSPVPSFYLVPQQIIGGPKPLKRTWPFGEGWDDGQEPGGAEKRPRIYFRSSYDIVDSQRTNPIETEPRYAGFGDLQDTPLPSTPRKLHSPSLHPLQIPRSPSNPVVRSSRDAPDEEPWIDTPLVTPNGSLQRVDSDSAKEPIAKSASKSRAGLTGSTRLPSLSLAPLESIPTYFSPEMSPGTFPESPTPRPTYSSPILPHSSKPEHHTQIMGSSGRRPLGISRSPYLLRNRELTSVPPPTHPVLRARNARSKPSCQMIARRKRAMLPKRYPPTSSSPRRSARIAQKSRKTNLVS